MSKHPSNKYNLVADIGGTNTRVALADGVTLLPQTVARYSNSKYPDLQSVLRNYIVDQGNVNCAGACVAVAGPVRNGVGALTNIDWAIDHETLANATQAETVAILNDLQAQGHALGLLPDSSLTSIIATPDTGNHSAKLVVGIGTGFNIAPVYDTDFGCLVPPSECGHTNLPVHSEHDLGFYNYVQEINGFCAVEDALSGRGLEQIYHWLGRKTNDAAERSAPEIMEALASGNDQQATQAAHMFVRLLAMVVGNQTLSHLPFGGVYMAGGVARAFAPYLARFDFEATFRDRGRFSDFMGNFSVSVVEDDNAALIGCARHLHTLS